MVFGNRVVIVTGAGGNLGSAIAEELSRRGATLVCADYSSAALDATLKRLAPGATALPIAGLDLSKAEDAQKLVAVAIERYGHVDALTNTVGGFRMAPVGPAALTEWDFLMNINARATLATSAAVLPPMIERRYGRIVHVAAAAGLKGGAELAAYSASKAAVMRIVESLAEEARDHGVTANCILPGTIDTPQNRAAMPDADASKWVTPANLARVVAFLISDEGGAITGAAIPVTQRM